MLVFDVLSSLSRSLGLVLDEAQSMLFCTTHLSRCSVLISKSWRPRTIAWDSPRIRVAMGMGDRDRRGASSALPLLFLAV